MKSVSNPEQTKRCVFDKKTKTLNKKKAANDLLSPPHLTSETDSMGAFKDEILKDDIKYEPTYGEAIVEVRMIDDIPESVLCRISTFVNNNEYDEKMKGRFLSRDFSRGASGASVRYINTICDLQTQAESLFLYIIALLTGGSL